LVWRSTVSRSITGDEVFGKATTTTPATRRYTET
jgi:hypothetical protein